MLNAAWKSYSTADIDDVLETVICRHIPSNTSIYRPLPSDCGQMWSNSGQMAPTLNHNTIQINLKTCLLLINREFNLYAKNWAVRFQET